MSRCIDVRFRGRILDCRRELCTIDHRPLLYRFWDWVAPSVADGSSRDEYVIYDFCCYMAE